MDDQRKYAILFAATISATRKLNDSGNTAWAVHVAVTDAIDKTKLILEQIDERWPAETRSDAGRWGGPTPSLSRRGSLGGGLIA